MNGQEALLNWLRRVYPGETAGGNAVAQPHLAAQQLPEHAAEVSADPYLACAVGSISVLRRMLEADPAWVNRTGGLLNLPPLVAVTHSGLSQLPQFQDALLSCAKLLLANGANPDQSIGTRWPPASLAAPDIHHPLTALYGAAGQHLNLEMTRALLSAGANPDDGECLYHSLGNAEITRLLLEAGVPIGPNNALYHAFDFADPKPLIVLLQFGANPNQPPLGPPTSWFGSPLLWAIRRRVSMAHYEALLSAGADTRTTTPNGITAFQLARRYGLPEVAKLLVRRGASADPGYTKEQFLGDCGCNLVTEAWNLMRADPTLLSQLTTEELSLLPELLAAGAQDAGRLMVNLGWPLDAKGGDWDATALNIAVLQGDVALTHFLLERGSSWQETHGYGSNVCGTLSWACRNRPTPNGDWVGCARALLQHGMPHGEPVPGRPGIVLIDGNPQGYTPEVAQVLTVQ